MRVSAILIARRDQIRAHHLSRHYQPHWPHSYDHVALPRWIGLASAYLHTFSLVRYLTLLSPHQTFTSVLILSPLRIGNVPPVSSWSIYHAYRRISTIYSTSRNA